MGEPRPLINRTSANLPRASAQRLLRREPLVVVHRLRRWPSCSCPCVAATTMFTLSMLCTPLLFEAPRLPSRPASGNDHTEFCAMHLVFRRGLFRVVIDVPSWIEFFCQ